MARARESASRADAAKPTTPLHTANCPLLLLSYACYHAVLFSRTLTYLKASHGDSRHTRAKGLLHRMRQLVSPSTAMALVVGWLTYCFLFREHVSAAIGSPY